MSVYKHPCPTGCPDNLACTVANRCLKEESMELAELIAQLEKATGPSRELDEAVCRFLGTFPEITNTGYDWHRSKIDGQIWRAANVDGTRSENWTAPAYTSSIDAALALVPEKCQFVNLTHFSDGWYASVGKHSVDGIRHEGNQISTPALALCIAALKARSHARPAE